MNEEQINDHDFTFFLLSIPIFEVLSKLCYHSMDLLQIVQLDVFYCSVMLLNATSSHARPMPTSFSTIHTYHL